MYVYIFSNNILVPRTFVSSWFLALLALLFFFRFLAFYSHFLLTQQTTVWLSFFLGRFLSNLAGGNILHKNSCLVNSPKELSIACVWVSCVCIKLHERRKKERSGWGHSFKQFLETFCWTFPTWKNVGI